MKPKLALTLTSSALLAGGCTDAHKPASSPAPPAGVNAAHLAGLSKAELKKQLTAIERAPAPRKRMGAMCYDMAPPPDRLDYVCPVCGGRTLYINAMARRWAFELNTCRRLFKELPQRESLTLDESSFCRNCQPGTNEPALNLILRFDDGTTHKVPHISDDDLRLLNGFLGGKRTVKGPQDDESPLKDELPRLRQLLGLKNE